MVQAIESTTKSELSDAERKRLVRGANEEDLVNSGLEETMSVALRQIRDHQTANPGIPDLRTAAFVSAIEKIARSYLELGIFP
jgi:glutamate dehydrogenase (NAD(P)+)